MADRDYVEVYRDSAGLYRWRRQAMNGLIVADSGQGYKRKWWAMRMARKLNGGRKRVVFDVT